MLKIYQWERETFKDLYFISIDMDKATVLINDLAKWFSVPVPVVTGGGRMGAGRYFRHSQTIRLSQCHVKLGTTIHEFAHHLNHIRHNGRGHTGTFKASLCHAYAVAKQIYKPKEEGR